MLWDTIERVNRLRQQSMNNPEFVASAKAHQQALEKQEDAVPDHSGSRRRVKSAKTLADIYKPVEFRSSADHEYH
ncbi:hypothetical protein [Vibrio sp.]|uniref:hypothetical protein n=1 Tax=Vibrio sp. TaxID=678 RepID=UPI003D115216